MNTFLCTLMLEVYYRYLPTFVKVPEDDSQKAEDIDDEDDLGLDFT